MVVAGSTIPAERTDSGAIMMVVGFIPMVTRVNPSTMGMGRTPHALDGGGQFSDAF
jgi:hypothetical protein